MENLKIDHPLTGIIQARRIALIGASENNFFSVSAARNLTNLGYPFFPITRGGKSVFGRSGYASCLDVNEPIDAAYVVVPSSAVKAAVLDGLAAGVRNFIVCASGYAEVGAEGIALQQDLVELCRSQDAIMMGPNCVGFANYVDETSIGTVTYKPTASMPSVGVICGSGLISNRLETYLRDRNGAATHVFATGNEAMVDASLIADYLARDPRVRAIAIFLEAVRNPEIFEAMAARALEAEKPVVVVKAGSSEQTAAIAAAHTGAFVGDDNVFTAVCERYGVIRAHSIEELMTTAQVAGYTGKLKKPGVAFVSQSGGACVLISDRAEKVGLSVPQFQPETIEQLDQILSSEFGHALNPLDLTGAVVKDPTLYEKVMRIVDNDPQVGLTVCHYDVMTSDVLEAMRPTMVSVARGARRCDPVAPIMSANIIQLDETQQRVVKEVNIPFIFSGIEHGVAALANIARWSQTPPAAARTMTQETLDIKPRSERETLDFLKSFDVPVIPAVVARLADDAVVAARDFGGPVVLKVISPDIAHKTEVGGVKLNLIGDAAVYSAFNDITASVKRAMPLAKIDGIAVSPMRGDGLELIVGVTRDPQWGLVMALGLGGVWVEVLKDVKVMLLPVTKADVLDALSQLRAKKLLEGYRGQPAADLSALADIVVKVSAAAQALSADLISLEINPLFVKGHSIEALDALAIWRD